MVGSDATSYRTATAAPLGSPSVSTFTATKSSLSFTTVGST
jgi:hypothetical protein